MEMWPVFLLLIGTGFQVDGSAIHFDSTTDSFSPLTTNNLTLRCSLTDTTSYKKDATDGTSHCNLTSTTHNVDYVTSIVLTKDGVVIASVLNDLPAKALISSPGLQVTGRLANSPGKRGYLDLTWVKMTKEQTGNFRCNINTIDKIGNSFGFSKTLKIVTENISIQDLVQDLIGIHQEKEKMINALKKENDDIKQMLNTKVFFSAGATSPQYVPVGEKILYDKVFSNVGGGYDVTTGTFTCPVTGHYHVEINGLNQADKQFYCQLQQNNQPVMMMFGSATQHFQGSSNSVVLKLNQGDVLRVISLDGSGSYMFGTPIHIYTTFNAQLVAII